MNWRAFLTSKRVIAGLVMILAYGVYELTGLELAQDEVVELVLALLATFGLSTATYVAGKERKSGGGGT